MAGSGNSPVRQEMAGDTFGGGHVSGFYFAGVQSGRLGCHRTGRAEVEGRRHRADERSAV